MNSFCKIALVAFSIVLFGCAPRVPNFFVEPTWTEKPTNVFVVYTEPVIENQDDLEDDLKDYAENFDEWFNPELKKYLDLFARNTVQFTLTKADSSQIVPDTAEIQDTNMIVPAFKGMEGNGVYLVLSNIVFSRREDSYMHHGFQTTMPNTNQNMNGDNINNYYTENALWVSSDYAFYDAKTGDRLAFGRQSQRSRFTYAMTTGDWEKCVKGLAKKILLRTPLLNR